MAIALPLAGLLLVEALLRAAGVGNVRREPFQPVPGRTSHVALHPDYGGMFFRRFRPNVAFDPFLAEKPPRALRIVALGGSTTAGFPYHWYYGFPALLEERIAAAQPGTHVEVANLGMTATNSYTIWALADAVVEQEPDAVVIYSGHNEFYGAFGTSGTQGWTGRSRWAKHFLIRASTWSLVAGPSSLLEDEALPAGERRTLMARIVRDASIQQEDEAFASAIAQFESNLRSALGRFERAGIPVFLATVASNLADQPPLGDDPRALAAYDRGRTLLAAGDTAAAREAFVEAKELDGIRFRAPEAMNEVIWELGDTFSNVTVVDVQARLRAESPRGIEGAALFTDHLHPNARGYALIAEAFFGAMMGALPDLQAASVRGAAPDSEPGFAGPDPVPTSPTLDPVEAAYSDLQLTMLTSGYPFRKDRTPAEAESIARSRADAMARSGRYAEELAVRVPVDGVPMANVLDEAVDRALAESDTLGALRLYRALLYWQPFNRPLMEQAISLAIQSPAFDAQTARLARYAAIHSGGSFSLNALAALALRDGDLERAEALLVRVEETDPQSEEMLYNRARLLVMQGDTAAARAYFDRYRAVAH